MDALRKNAFFVAAVVLAIVWIGLSIFATSIAKFAILPALLAALCAAAGTARRSARWGIVAAAALGLGCAAYLFQQKLSAEAGPAICDLSETFTCTAVNNSPYSVVAGIPITLLGAAYYAGMVAAGIFGRKDDDGDARFAQLATLTGLVGVAYAIFLAVISVRSGTFCVFCITMYLVNLLILVAGALDLRARGKGLLYGADALIGSRDTIAFVIVSGVVLWLGVGAYRDANPLTALEHPTADVPPASRRSQLSMLYRAPKGEVPDCTDQPRLGPANARYQVVEFADFGCPHCADAKGELEEIVASRDDVAVCFNYFPLSGECTVPAAGAERDGRCDAAIAAECAHRQGKFWEMATQLFTNLGYFAPEQLDFMADKIGLDVPAWKACLADPSAMARVNASRQAGEAAGVAGTPALFVKGLRPGQTIDVVAGPRALLMLLEARDDGTELAPGAAQP